MNISNSIVKKLVIYFLLLNIFTVIVVGSYSYYRAKDALVERTFDQLTSLRIEKKNRIERFFNDRILDVSLVSKSEDVKNILTFLNDENRNLNDKASINIYAEYDKFLRKHFLSGNYYKQFYVVNSDGFTVSISASEKDSTLQTYSSVDKLLILNLWDKIFDKPEIIIDDYKLDTITNLPAIFIGAPVTDKQANTIGIVAIEIDIDAINSIMFENNPHNGLGKSGESYLVGSDYLMRSTSRFQNNSVFKTSVNTKCVREALNGNTGTNVIQDYRGITVLSSFSKVDIPGLDWAILAEIDEKEAMVPIDSIRNNILYLSVLISLLLFAFVFIIARRISLPIIKLKEAANHITRGDYDVFVEDIVSSDEIGSLIDAFNEMSLKIKEQTENLKLERSMRLSSMIDGQELERQRLSRELHDGLGQSILAIKMHLERMTNASSDKSKQIMAELQVLFTNTISEVRSISNNLMPAVLNEFGLVDALKNLFREVNLNTGIHIEFDYEEFELEIEDKINTYLYRICQEALNNIIKHSEAKSAEINIKSNDNNVYLRIRDDGKGFNYDEERKLCGNGISNMKERVHLLNGNIEINSQNGKGTIIHLNIPLKTD
jgi:signal transduction histidine kinase